MKKIHLPTIFCHIVGLCRLDKPHFVKFFKGNDAIILCDLTDINAQYCSLFHNQSHQHWRQYMQEHLLDCFIKNSSKSIIVLGYPMHFDDKRVKITINAKLKCFVKVSNEHYTTQTILYNLTQYQDDIIHGQFPLKYLNPDFLLANRQSLIKLFSQYCLKSIPRICNAVQMNLQKQRELESIQHLYCAHAKKFEKIIPLESTGIIEAYTEPWLALVSLASRGGKKLVMKGFRDAANGDTPFIKEMKPTAFNALNCPAYLYMVEKMNFVFHEKGKQRKLVTHSSVIIVKRKRIPNIYKYMRKQKDVTMYHYKG